MNDKKNLMFEELESVEELPSAAALSPSSQL